MTYTILYNGQTVCTISSKEEAISLAKSFCETVTDFNLDARLNSGRASVGLGKRAGLIEIVSQDNEPKPVLDIKTTTNEAGYAVGDFIYLIWGWEQTNIDFYRVEKVTAKSISLIKVKNRKIADKGWAVAEVAPSDDLADFDIFNANHKEGKTIRVMTNVKYPAIKGHNIHRYEGKPLVESSYA